MNQPLLSVIVPCYNVEIYIDKCISSIVGQTYSNLEIILINDGSTDNTGILCNSWQERDNRIKVIHKQNEGASYARKDGVNTASGEYVTFVDADDWIDPAMYSDMMAAMLTTNSDIAKCDIRWTHDNKKAAADAFTEIAKYDTCWTYDNEFSYGIENEKKKGTIEIVGKKEGVLLICENRKWFSVMWDKIFKKSLFKNVEFSKNRGLADDFITLYLFHNASQIAHLYCEYYFYFQRIGSISYPTDIRMKLKNLLDNSDAHFERYSFITQHPEYHSALSFLKFETIRLNMDLLDKMIVVSPQHFINDYFSVKVSQLRSIPLTHEDKLGRFLKLKLYMLKISPKKVSPKLYLIMTKIFMRYKHKLFSGKKSKS